MPLHRVPSATLYEDLVAIERDGEVVVQVLPEPPSPSGAAYAAPRHIVITRPAGGASYETRGAA